MVPLSGTTSAKGGWDELNTQINLRSGYTLVFALGAGEWQHAVSPYEQTFF